MHRIGGFPDGAKEAILASHHIENREIKRTKTLLK
jgi:hypothetical protein